MSEEIPFKEQIKQAFVDIVEGFLCAKDQIMDIRNEAGLQIMKQAGSTKLSKVSDASSIYINPINKIIKALDGSGNTTSPREIYNLVKENASNYTMAEIIGFAKALTESPLDVDLGKQVEILEPVAKKNFAKDIQEIQENIDRQKSTLESTREGIEESRSSIESARADLPSSLAGRILDGLKAVKNQFVRDLKRTDLGSRLPLKDPEYTATGRLELKKNQLARREGRVDKITQKIEEDEAKKARLEQELDIDALRDSFLRDISRGLESVEAAKKAAQEPDSPIRG